MSCEIEADTTHFDAGAVGGVDAFDMSAMSRHTAQVDYAKQSIQNWR